MPQHRMHYYLVSANIHFVKDGKPKQKPYNMVMQTLEKKITASALNSSRQAMFQRLFMEDDIPQEDIKNIIFNSFSHLGFMTEKEFEDMPEDKTAH